VAKKMPRLKVGKLTRGNAADVARLWRRCFPGDMAVRHGNPSARPLTARNLVKRTIESGEFDPAGSQVATARNRAVGFCLAAMGSGRHKRDGYLSAIAVEPRLRRQGVGSFLMRRAERYLVRRSARRILTTFEGNPLTMLLGVPTDSEAYPFFLNRGFRSYDRSLLLVMRQDASRFRFSKGIRERIRKLEAEGIRIGHFEPRDMEGLKKLTKRHFKGWSDAILASARNGGNIIVAARGKRVLGYSGPFRVTDMGNGGFNSVGVDPRERGRGIGAAVFNVMCRELRDGGARWVVLTTGLANPAQEIYVRAGYRTLFIVDYGMRRELAVRKSGAAKKKGAAKRTGARRR
jgi:GNAT superfamily N-acetyltransferase